MSESIRLVGVDPEAIEAIAVGVLSAMRHAYQADAQAAGQVQAVGEELQAAATALQRAADALRHCGQGLQANAAIQAHRRAAQAAEGLLGG